MTATARAWCPTCRTIRGVTDVHEEGHYEFGREVGYRVTDLDCGHEAVTPPVDLGPGPGAPYAGNHRPVSPNIRTSNLVAAGQIDPWADQ